MDRLNNRAAWTAAALLALSTALPVSATVIDSVAYFQSLPHTLIDFESDGQGNPLSLADGQSLVMPLSAYSPQGVTFLNQVRWVNDGSPAFDTAQDIGGSLDHAIPSAFVNSFAFTFSVPVRAFGFWVVNNQGADPAGPIFRAYDAQDNLIDSVQFNGTLIDGTVNDGTTVAGYGIMGLAADRDIARVEVQKVAAIFDDLRFTPVPAPGPIALAGLGTILLVGRRGKR
jgi:hypothetical protein